MPTTCGHHHADAPADKADTRHDPFEQLAACHRHVLATVGNLAAAMDVLEREQDFTPEVLAAVGDTLAVIHVAIPLHSADEEQTLFPRLRERPPFAGTSATPMDCMESEHVEHRGCVDRLAKGVVQRDIVATLRAGRHLAHEYTEHIGKEDEILFPMARQMLTDPNELAAMADEMHARRVDAGLRSC
jgi:iron-sulfur cluster repair protein YtfE (RIC family)